MSLRPTRPILLALAAVVAGCDGDPPTPPPFSPFPPSGLVSGGTGSGRNTVTVIAVNDGPVRFARLRPDSAPVLDLVAYVRLSGTIGDSVMLDLQASDDLLGSVGPDARVLVDADETQTAFALGRLVGGATVYRFTETGPLEVRYFLPRTVARGVSRGKFWLAQRTTAPVESVDAPWIPKLQRPTANATPGVAAAVDPGYGCYVAEANGTCAKGTTYTIEPWHQSPGPSFGAFQSGENGEASTTITIRFSRPILSVWARIWDPSFEGNTMTLVGVGTVAFAYGPAADNNDDVKTMAGETSEIILTPAPADYVVYTMWVEESPPPTTDPTVMVACTNSGPTRGATVTCETRVSPPQSFTVIARTAKDANGSWFTVQDLTRKVYGPGGVDEWTGEAVTGSVVSAVVELPDGRTIANGPPGEFTVVQRMWPSWREARLKGGQEEYKVAPGDMVPYPSEAKTLGLHTTLPPTSDEIRVDAPSSGPNKGLGYVTDSLPTFMYAVTVHPGLLPVPSGTNPKKLKPYQEWYLDQNGDPVGTCTFSDMATILFNVRRHEGALGPLANSHPGVANRVLASERPDLNVERLFTQRSRSELTKQVYAAYNAFYSGVPYQVEKNEFDFNEETTPGPVFPCYLDVNRSNR